MDFNSYTKINIGCGYSKLPGYLNLDVDAAAEPDFLLKDNDLSFLPQRHFDEVLAHNVLEHIPHEHTASALLDWAKLLKLNGILDVETSNVLGIFEQMQRKEDFEQEYNWMKCLFGNQKHPGDIHFYGFTPRTLRTFLEIAGFSFDGFQIRDLWVIRCRAVKSRDWTQPLEFEGDDANFVVHAYREVLKRDPEGYIVDYHCKNFSEGPHTREGLVKTLVMSEENLYSRGRTVF